MCCWRLNCFNGAKPSIGKYLVTTCFSCKSAFMFVAKRSQGTTFRFSIWSPRQASAESLQLQLIKIRTNISWSIYKRKIRWTSDCYDFRGIKKADIIVGLVTYDANSCKVTLFPCRTNNLLLMVPSRVTKIFHCRWDDQHPAIALPSQSFRGANARPMRQGKGCWTVHTAPVPDPLVVATNSAAVSWRIHWADSKLMSTVKMKKVFD